jgi:hypothetical protein
MKAHTIWIISILFIIITILVSIFCYYHYKEEQQKVKKKVIFIARKLGGVNKADMRLEIYEDKTYKLFNFGHFIREDSLSDFLFHLILDLKQNLIKFKNTKCPSIDPSFCNYIFEIDNIKINLGQINSNCIVIISQKIFNSIKDIDSLMIV